MKTSITKAFEEKFGCAPALVVQSPGRVNIIGEHTDYNEGFVLPAAIDKVAAVAISLRSDDVINLYASDLNENFTGSVNNLSISQCEWANYIVGAAAQFAKLNKIKVGFDAIVASTVPMGAGLSSSAALESAVVFALNHLLETNIERNEMVRMAQKVEHEFAGVNCGIMDMFASMMGKANNAIKLDCATLDYEYIPLDITGYKIVLLNTNVKHNLASSEYNTRRKECEQGVAWIAEKYPEVTSLRKATMPMFDECIAGKNEKVAMRCKYVIEEIERLQTACDDLRKGNLEALGKKMFATHDGLSELYEVSCKELDFLVNFVRNKEGVLGARMMGGGFGGCTINIVKEENIDALVAEIAPTYEAAMGLKLDAYIAAIQDGTEIL